tara:strand:+ start:118 stop:477 length:360 start_codon:yes stop_codon:yes gene_type:complete
MKYTKQVNIAMRKHANKTSKVAKLGPIKVRIAKPVSSLAPRRSPARSSRSIRSASQQLNGEDAAGPGQHVAADEAAAAAAAAAAATSRLVSEYAGRSSDAAVFAQDSHFVHLGGFGRAR